MVRKPEKVTVEEASPQWSKPLHSLNAYCEELLKDGEGSIGWPMVENASRLGKGEFERFAAHWKARGVYIEKHGNGGADGLSLRVTNSIKPIIVDGGGWFKVWSDRIANFRTESMKGMRDRYGNDNRALNSLLEAGFHLGVWIGPDYEPVYFGEPARQLLLKNTGKIIGLIMLCSEQGRHTSAEIAAYAIPAPFALLGEHLTQEHIDAICNGIARANRETRENLMAHTLRSVVTAKKPEEVTPELITATFEATSKIIGESPINKYNRDDSVMYPDDIAKSVGEFIEAAGDRFQPEYLEAFAANSELARRKDLYFIGNFGAAFFVRNDVTPVTPEEFGRCLTLAHDLLSAFGEDEGKRMMQSLLPHLVRKVQGGGTAMEQFEKVREALARIPVRAEGLAGSVMSSVHPWAWTAKDRGNAFIAVDDVGKVVDEMLSLRTAAKKPDALYSTVLGSILWSHEGYMTPEELHEYRAVLEEANPKKLEKFFPLMRRICATSCTKARKR